MKRYLTVTIIIAVIAVFDFISYGNRNTATLCKDGWPYHAYPPKWEVVGRSSHFFGRDRVLLKRHCRTCGQVETKESN